MAKDTKQTGSRRDFLKTAGKFAVYTPPALMIMGNAKANGIYESCNQLATRKCVRPD
ncbi:MAG: hypothetical protein ACRBDX_06325 [Gammaproteobacteria bacterium]